MRRRRIGLSTVLVVTALVALVGCSGGAGSAPEGVPATVRVRDRVIPYAGAQGWRVASVPSRSSRALTVFATGSDAVGGGPCGPAVVRLRARETASTVRVLAADYQQTAGVGLGCAAIGYAPSPHTVRLAAPLGHRRLSDASTGRPVTLLVGTEYPDIARPPGEPARGVLELRNADGPVQRTWTYRDGRQLTLQIEAPEDTRAVSPYGRTVRQLRLHGSPATVYSTGGRRYGTQQVVWTPNPQQTLVLLLSNSPKRTWTLSEAVDAARSVGGYSTVASDRLAQPTSPGTAAATYNSADGPVRHAENMFKSSGVYLAVSCQGAGEVTVTLREVDHRFRCTDTLSHEVRRSVGPPNDPFFLDVVADPGVRWAVTLARASLDGT